MLGTVLHLDIHVGTSAPRTATRRRAMRCQTNSPVVTPQPLTTPTQNHQASSPLCFPHARHCITLRYTCGHQCPTHSYPASCDEVSPASPLLCPPLCIISARTPPRCRTSLFTLHPTRIHVGARSAAPGAPPRRAPRVRDVVLLRGQCHVTSCLRTRPAHLTRRPQLYLPHARHCITLRYTCGHQCPTHSYPASCDEVSDKFTAAVRSCLRTRPAHLTRRPQLYLPHARHCITLRYTCGHQRPTHSYPASCDEVSDKFTGGNATAADDSHPKPPGVVAAMFSAC